MSTNLYHKKDLVGKRVEEIITQKGLTKLQVCKEAGLSRPTLDKLIDGDIRNERNFYKHLSLLLRYFKMSSEQLLTKTKVSSNKSKEDYNLRIEGLVENTGITEKRLDEINQGSPMTAEEMQELALYFNTSIRGLDNQHYFENQKRAKIYQMCGTVDAEYENEIWGYVEIQLTNSKVAIAYPITEFTRDMIKWQWDMDHPYIVIPCLKNKLLYVNKKHVKSMKLMDEETAFSCGYKPHKEEPLVMYEVYKKILGMTEKERANQLNLTRLEKEILELLENEEINEKEMRDKISKTTIDFSDLSRKEVYIDFTKEENLSHNILRVYEWGRSSIEQSLFYTTENGELFYDNASQVAIIEMPLLQVEEAIIKNTESGLPETEEEEQERENENLLFMLLEQTALV